MRLHLSGPMTGIEHLNRPAFMDVASILRSMGHEPWNPHEEVHPDTEYRLALARNLSWICEEAQGQVLLPGWSDSRGSFTEAHAAQACGLPRWIYRGGIFEPFDSLAAKRGTLRALGAAA